MSTPRYFLLPRGSNLSEEDVAAQNRALEYLMRLVEAQKPEFAKDKIVQADALELLCELIIPEIGLPGFPA